MASRYRPSYAPGPPNPPSPGFGFNFGGEARAPPKTPMDRATELAESLSSRISLLGLDLWQRQVYGLIFLHAFQSPTLFPFGNEHQVRTLLEKLEKFETTALLKLAAWKVACQMNPPKELVKTTLETFLWFKTGWKVAKATHKSQPSIDIIAQSVQEFL